MSNIRGKQNIYSQYKKTAAIKNDYYQNIKVLDLNAKID